MDMDKGPECKKKKQQKSNDKQETMEIDVNSPEIEKIWSAYDTNLRKLVNLLENSLLRDYPQKYEIDTLLQIIQRQQASIKQISKEPNFCLKIELLKLEEKYNQSLTEISSLQDQIFQRDQKLKFEMPDLSNIIEFKQNVGKLQQPLANIKEKLLQLEDTIELNKIQATNGKFSESNPEFNGYENLIMKLKNDGCITTKVWSYCLTENLLRASEHGNIYYVNFLLSIGADANAKLHGDHAFILACQNGHKDVVTSLLNYGMDINCADHKGYTLLHMAAAKGYLPTVKELLCLGVCVNTKSIDNVTPLHCSAMNGHLDIVNELIMNGAEVNCKNEMGTTPIQLSAQHGHENIVNELLKNGANINDKNVDYENPFQLDGRNEYVNNVDVLCDDVTPIKNKIESSCCSRFYFNSPGCI